MYCPKHKKGIKNGVKQAQPMSKYLKTKPIIKKSERFVQAQEYFMNDDDHTLQSCKITAFYEF